MTLDDWRVEQDVRPDFIKIDAEGHDVAVVKGAAAVIARHRPTILMEASGTDDEQRLFEAFSQLYRIVRVPAINDRFWQPDYRDALPFYREHGEGEAVNIGFIPLPR